MPAPGNTRTGPPPPERICNGPSNPTGCLCEIGVVRHAPSGWGHEAASLLHQVTGDPDLWPHEPTSSTAGCLNAESV